KPMSQVAPDVPPQLDAVIQRCMRKNPDDRWQSMNEARMELLALKLESDSGILYASRIGAPPAVTQNARREKRAMAGIAGTAAFVLLAAALAGFWLWNKSSPAATNKVDVVQQQPALPQIPPQDTGAKAVEEALTNDGIVKLIQEKVPVELILDHIRSS